MSHHAAIGSETGEQVRVERSTIIPRANVLAMEIEMEGEAFEDDEPPTIESIAPLFDEDGNLTFAEEHAAGPRREEIAPPPREIARWLRACALVRGTR